MIKRLAVCVAVLAVPLCARAHIGSPNVFYEGLAGPYHLKVIVRPPSVVPGLAEISVRVLSGRVQRVTVLPVRWNAGRKGAPPPDEAALVRGETNLFNAELWLMTSVARFATGVRRVIHRGIDELLYGIGLHEDGDGDDVHDPTYTISRCRRPWRMI